ncbi:sporulation protein [Paenibacillus chartarius]|uniref:Sporulation protein n=1 Tax=Paenibacillus chartarius TaxID=747481 RepID=A0ABV6DQ07_9BACL
MVMAAMAVTLFSGFTVKSEAATGYDVTLGFPFNRYPLTGDHIRDAIAAGHPSVCTIDRDGAAQNRKESLAGIPTKTGYDRDEWPMAMCEEGGYGADVRYVPSSDNRGAGAWVGNQLSQYPDGTRVKFYMNYN